MASYPRYLSVLLVSLGIVLAAGARIHAQPAPGTLFEYMTPEQTGVNFTNTVWETEAYNALAYANAYNGNGVAAGDVNGDGLPDLFFTGTHVSSRLYLNRGNFHFEDVTAKAGLLDSTGIERGAVMADIDGDGDLDIYICRIRARNLLYINNGDGTFTESAKKFGLDYMGNSTHAVFFDYDNDGDLDMYLGLTGNSTQDYYARWGDCDKLFRNDGKGKFTEVTKQAGISDAGYCNNVVVGDVNNDGWADIFICNDFEGRDYLYINNRNGTFAAATGSLLLHTSNSSMGSDIADYNNDGWPDIISVDMLPEDRLYQLVAVPPMSVYNPTYDSIQVQQNVLQLNRGNGFFSEIAPLAGVVATNWSWPALIADFDNDGYKDLFIGNGMRRYPNNADSTFRINHGLSNLMLTKRLDGLHVPNYAFRNDHNLKFTNVSADWGLNQISYTNGAVYVDLDQDGDLDLVTNNVDSVAFVFRNHAVENHLGNFLRVKLAGTGMNRFGIGARVELKTAGGLRMQENFPSRGYISTVDEMLVFGLGADTVINEVTVKWPGGAQQVLANIAANQTITLKQTDASKKGIVPPKPVTPLFTMLDSSKGINYRHIENTFDDLKRERILPHRLSQLGPGAAVGDVNGDGLEDVYIGSAQGFTSYLFLQQQDGHFVQVKEPAFDVDKAAEDMGSVLFDADGDGDLDLYVVSGGNDFFENDDALQDRLYLNDGKGHFTKAANALPEETTSGSCVTAADFDGDGDLDLFVGGRVVPGKYPLPTRSYILRNDHGIFTDVTAQVAPELVKPGMVCAAVWSDFDNDGHIDLVCTGEWMNIKFMHNDGGHFSESKGTGIDSATGWWNSLTPVDIDDDGDMDYIVGNIGLNWRYKTSPEHPIESHTADFDGNGSLDFIISYFDQHDQKRYPIIDRPRIISQIPSMQAKFTSYAAYGRASLEEVFPKAKLDSAYKLNATTFATSWVENLGNGKFAIHPLPDIAQISPTFGTVAEDFDGDGKMDILLTGNFYDGPEPIIPRRDAGCGLMLKGDGRGNFTPLTIAESGFLTRGDARALATVRGAKNSTTLYEVVTNSNSIVQTFARDMSAGGEKLFTVDRALHCTHAIVKFDNGHVRRYEFPTGSSYLTTSTPTFAVTPMMKSATLYNGANIVKEIVF